MVSGGANPAVVSVKKKIKPKKNSGKLWVLTVSKMQQPLSDVDVTRTASDTQQEVVATLTAVIIGPLPRPLDWQPVVTLPASRQRPLEE